MKKLFVFCLLMVIGAGIFSQETSPALTFSKQDYLKKAKTQTTVGTVLVVSSATCFAGGILVALNNLFSDENPATAFFITSGALLVSSITLFIAAGRNNRKARNVSAFITMERMPVVFLNAKDNSFYPSLGLQLTIR